jgi:hypothetical protein
MSPTAAKKTLIALKHATFEALGLTSTPRTEKVFDLIVSFVLWALVDGHHTPDTVQPYLTASMKAHMSQNAFSYLDQPSVKLSDAACAVLSLDDFTRCQKIGVFELCDGAYRGDLAKLAGMFEDVGGAHAGDYPVGERRAAASAAKKIRIVLAHWAKNVKKES